MEGSPPVDRIPSEPAIKRYKFLWRLFLISNFAIGAYMFAQAGKRERGKKKSAASAEVAPATAVTAPAQEEPVVSPPVVRPVIERPPIPQDQQHEVFKWILEEKRKVKPQNREEKKKRIDEDKAILKEFIRSESVPRI